MVSGARLFARYKKILVSLFGLTLTASMLTGCIPDRSTLPVGPNVLASGGTLSAGEQLVSPNGQSVLRLQSDQNLVEYDATTSPWTPIWSTNTVNSGATHLEMQGDANLVLYRGSEATQPVWASGSSGFNASLVLQDDTNLVVYQSNGPLWSRITGLLSHPPTTAPGAPTLPRASIGAADQSVISWSPPQNDGGAQITGYSVTSSPGVTPPISCTNTIATNCVFTGLSSNTAYTFSITASNSQGVGVAATTEGGTGTFSVSINGPSPEATPSPGTPSAPGIFPAFSRTVTDYVSRCSGSSPIPVAVYAAPGITVTVDGQSVTGVSTTINVTRAASQEFPLTITDSTGTTTHYVRCLPLDFPTWTVTGSGVTQSDFYITAPLIAKSYPTIFDNHGVPMWWTTPPFNPGYATLLPNNHVLYGDPQNVTGRELTLDGATVRNFAAAVGGISIPSDEPFTNSDMHEVKVLPAGAGPSGAWGGYYLTVTFEPKSGVDLSGLCIASQCGPASASIWDAVIKVTNPAGHAGSGTVVWSWRASDHIPVSEMDPQWICAFVIADGTSAPGCPVTNNHVYGYDVYHWNSIEYTPNGFILSYRHLDAIYNVDWTTPSNDPTSNSIVWKLGGRARPESLSILNDPYFPSSDTMNPPTHGFGGQHDARLNSNGTISLHDNGSGTRSRAPRVVRYQLDLSAKTATLVESRADATIPASFCCGSARLLPGGNWVTTWGGTSTFTETTPANIDVLRVTFSSGVLLYRAEPIFGGRLTREELRVGMNTQFQSG